MTPLSLMLLALTASPVFEVTNRCPQFVQAFVVTNRIPAVPAVTAKKVFRAGGYHAGHTCPNCGRQQWRVESGTPNVAGHTHKCDGCGTVWRH